jgi:hypothetical protein
MENISNTPYLSTGPSIGFAGSILSDKFLLEPLGDIIPLYGHPLFTPPLEKTARMFGALAKAVKSLRAYYENPDPQMNPTPDPQYPYVTRYTPLSEAEADSSPIAFRYMEKHPGSPFLFICEEVESKRILAVKFALNYSKDVHLMCAERKCAPLLYGFEKLAGGWYMVVMEYLGDHEYRKPNSSDRDLIQGTVKELILGLQQRNCVHGDIRRSNLLIGPKGSVKLLDFDWAGTIGVARYPRRINPMIDTWNKRPEGVEDGALITFEHDLAMLQLL